MESLDAYLDKVSGEILSAKTDIRKSERRIKAIDTTLSHIANHEAYKEVYKKYASIGWKTGRRSLPPNTGKNWTPTLPPSVFSKPIRRNCPLIRKN